MEREELVRYARRSIARGSKSFALASRLFDRVTRERAWLLYAWCRACDDLADDQDHGGDLGDAAGAEARLATIRERTAAALDGRETGDPSFDAFGLVSRECGITAALAEDVIAGFALDAAGWVPRSEADTLRYCYHVAGAVGVMMALVMGVAASDGDTLDSACDLGIGFQLANIARDVCEDDIAGRCYLPEEWLAEADIPPGEQMKPHYRGALVGVVQRLGTLQRSYEATGRAGAARLAFRQRWAVLGAAGIYGAIARQVECAGAHAWDHRQATSRAVKLGCLVRGLGHAVRPPAGPAAPPPLRRRELAAAAGSAGGTAARAR